MLASESPDFGDIVIPLLTGADQQVIEYVSTLA
jgi:hypothetical protein